RPVGEPLEEPQPLVGEIAHVAARATRTDPAADTVARVQRCDRDGAESQAVGLTVEMAAHRLLVQKEGGLPASHERFVRLAAGPGADEPPVVLVAVEPAGGGAAEVAGREVLEPERALLELEQARDRGQR